MSLSSPFIGRPIATSLLMVALLLAGLVAYRLLPVSALPQVDYPTIQVVAAFPGASPEVMASSVTAPLERQLGQMAGLNQMTSTSSNGAMNITLQFSLATGLDVAEQEVQAAINAASTYLPADLPNAPVYNKVNPADRPNSHTGLNFCEHAAAAGGRFCRYPSRPKNFAAAGGGAGEHQRRATSGGAHSGQSDGVERLWADAGRFTRRHYRRKRQYSQRQF